MIVINIFNFKLHDVCVEMRREGEKRQTKEEMTGEIRVQETNQTVMVVKVRAVGWRRGRQRQRRREDSQRPEHAALLVPTE